MSHKLFGPVNPGTPSHLSQGHLDVNQSKKFMFMCPLLQHSKRITVRTAKITDRTFILFHLGCRKWGFKRWGFKEIRGYLRKKAFFLSFLDFPGALQALRKRAKKGEKGRFRPISGKGGQTPLKPPFVTPPFAAAQFTAIQVS